MDQLERAREIGASLYQSLLLAKLVNATEGACVCAHRGLHVWYAPFGDSAAEPPDIPALCATCGGEQTLLRVIYGEEGVDPNE